MEIIISNIENRKKIEECLVRIFYKTKDKTLVDKIKNSSIIMTDENDALKIYKKKDFVFIKGLLEGPGAVKSNITYKNMIFHLVSINLKNNDELRFGEAELDGVISHELGHIFNRYNSKTVPTTMDAYNYSLENNNPKINFKKLIDEVNSENLSNIEFFADYFSKKTNSSEGLISSIELAIASNKFPDKNELFKERIIKLRSNEIFERK